MSTVTLSWSDPDKAVDFSDLAAELRRLGWLPDTSRDALVELVKDSTEEERDG